jgi:hypothetical protein
MSGTSASEVRYRLPSSIAVFFGLLAVLGGVALAAGLAAAPQRAWANLLLVAYYLAGLGLGGLVLVALLYVTGARWSLPVRRIPEAMTAVLPLAALGLIAVFFCRPSLYSWSGGGSAEAYESPLHHLWLNRPFFILRALVYLFLWSVFAVVIVRNSRQQDRDGDPARTRRNIRLSAAFLVVFGITCWLASNDWIMSLEPEWASTIFAVYNFAGLFVSALAAVILLALPLRARGPLKGIVTEDHLHDLGTLLFSFSSFWMYTWFCQYLLIWYVNNPEETAYLRQRWQGNWPAFLLLDVVLNWGIPFLVLLFRSAKRSPFILGAMALSVLIGRWVDLSLMIMPSQSQAVPIPGLIEAGLLLGSLGVFVLVFFLSLSKASLMPLRDPTGLGESESTAASPDAIGSAAALTSHSI